MRRADRLFQIVQHLRGRRLTTARQLADKLAVSERTIYRDIRDLTLSGVPIEGEAGVGYVLRRGFDIPPLMFDRDEIEALVVGARMVQAWGGVQLAGAAREALVKIEAALPADLKREIDRSRLFALDFKVGAELQAALDPLRQAINEQHKLSCAYRRENGDISRRVLQPLGLYFWGAIWTLAAWCELREDFRNFRVDRMSEIRILDENFAALPGRTLQDFLRKMRAEQ
jgi:predicted DNA-binding transcriptional regulator YafY